MKKYTFKECLEVLQAISIIAGILFICFQVYSQSKTLRDNQKIASAKFVLKVRDEVSKDKYNKTINEIEDHDSNYKIKVTNEKLEDYIGRFETLGDLVNDNIVIKDQVYNELSYELEKAWCNKGVQEYITKLREVDKNTGPTALYRGFQTLAEYSLAKDKDNDCAKADKE